MKAIKLKLDQFDVLGKTSSLGGWFFLLLFALVYEIGRPRLLPSLSEIPSGFMSILGKGILDDLIVSMNCYLMAVGLTIIFNFAILSLVSIPNRFGVMMSGLSDLISIGRFNGFVGLPLILTLLIGDLYWSKIIMLSCGMTLFLLPSLIDVKDTIRRDQYEHARTLQFGDLKILIEVVLWGKLTEYFGAVRTNIAMGWMMLPMVEGTFRTEGGIGVVLLTEDKYKKLDDLYATILLVLFTGFLIDKFAGTLEKIIFPWKPKK